MSSRNKKKIHIPGEEAEEGHGNAFQDMTGRRSVDMLFRKYGYRIWSRAGHDEPIWERQGVLYPQREVELRMDPDELKDAMYLEELYRAGYT